MMKLQEIIRIIEGTLFVAGDSISLDIFAQKFDLKQKDIDQIVKTLQQKYSDECGINILHFKNKLQLCSNPLIVDEISEILNPIREKALTRAALETVSIIAYKQPITKLEIENIRGVKSCDYAISILQANDLIKVIGRKEAVGKPLLYGTTDNFLKRFQICNLDELPDAKQILDRIRIISTNPNGLYNDFKISDEKIVSEYEVGEIRLEPTGTFNETFKNVDSVLRQVNKSVKQLNDDQEKQAEDETVLSDAKLNLDDLTSENPDNLN